MHYEGVGAQSFTGNPPPCGRERKEIPRGMKRHEIIFDEISKASCEEDITEKLDRIQVDLINLGNLLFGIYSYKIIIKD